jgi:hypothetical protein
MISTIRKNFLQIDQFCAECGALFRNYKEIREVNHARKNLEKSLRLLSDYRQVPIRAEELLDVLYEDETKIKWVYKQLRVLARHRRRAYEQGAAKYRQQLDQFFDKLLDVAEELEATVWENVHDMNVLGRSQPGVLIRTLEVIEMEDHASFKLFSGQRLGPDARPQPSAPNGAMRDKVFRILEQQVSERFGEIMKPPEVDAGDQAAAKEQQGGGSENSAAADEEKKAKVAGAVARIQASMETQVKDVLSKMQVVVAEVLELNDYVAPCFPPDYKIFAFLERLYRKFLLNTLNFYTGDLWRLSPRTILRCVSWLQWYQRQLLPMGMRVDELSTAVDELMSSYVKQSEARMMELVGNIIAQDEVAEAVADGKGYYYTDGPQDVFQLIHRHLDIVADQHDLRGRAMVAAVKMLVQVLLYYQRQLGEQLMSVQLEGDRVLLRGVQKDEYFLCALINNCFHSQENTEGVRERSVERIRIPEDAASPSQPAGDHEGGAAAGAASGGGALAGEAMAASEPSKAMGGGAFSAADDAAVAEVDNLFEDLIDGFVDVGTRCVDLLVLHMMNTLAEIFVGFFTVEWLEDEVCSGMRRIIATLQDFFGDFRNHLSREAFYRRLVRMALKGVAQEYAWRFLQTRPAFDCSALRDRMMRDNQLLQGFFQTDETTTGFVGEAAIVDETAVVEALYESLCIQPAALSLYHGTLATCFKGQALDALRRLLFIRVDLDRSARNDALSDFEQYLKKYGSGELRNQSSLFADKDQGVIGGDGAGGGGAGAGAGAGAGGGGLRSGFLQRIAQRVRLEGRRGRDENAD